MTLQLIHLKRFLYSKKPFSSQFLSLKAGFQPVIFCAHVEKHSCQVTALQAVWDWCLYLSQDLSSKMHADK